MRILYTLLVGVPLSVLLMFAGVMLCLTIVGIPLGLTCLALGVKVLTIQPRPVVRVHVDRR